MDSRFESVAAEYAARAAQELREMQTMPAEQLAARVDDLLLPVGEESATLLQLLVKGARAQRIVEVGTSYGYSTLYLADAAREVGGRVITIEIAERKSVYARDALTRAGLVDCVDFQVGDALKILPTISGPIDLVLIDLWKNLYVPSLELIAPKLTSGAIVVADNMLHPESARPHALAYQKRVRELGFDSVLLTVGSGLEVSRKR